MSRSWSSFVDVSTAPDADDPKGAVVRLVSGESMMWFVVDLDVDDG